MHGKAAKVIDMIVRRQIEGRSYWREILLLSLLPAATAGCVFRAVQAPPSDSKEKPDFSLAAQELAAIQGNQETTEKLWVELKKIPGYSILLRDFAPDYPDIAIEGSREFITNTRRALKLLGSSKLFKDKSRYVKIIRQAMRSGMAADLEKPTFEVGSRTWQSPTIWFAGAIAHDTCHSMLYHDEKKRKTESHSIDWHG